MFLWRCPTRTRIERFATNPAEDPQIARHIDRCEACRASVAEVLQDADLLRQFRAALDDRLSEDERRRIYELCLRAAEPPPTDT